MQGIPGYEYDKICTINRPTTERTFSDLGRSYHTKKDQKDYGTKILMKYDTNSIEIKLQP